MSSSEESALQQQYEGWEDQEPRAMEALLMSFFAGAATSVGGLVVCCLSPKRGVAAGLLAGTLSMAAGVMLAVSLLELVVPATEKAELSAFFYFGVGGVAYYGLSSFARFCSLVEKQKSRQKRARHLGILMCLALTAHNLPEGLAVAVTASTSRKTGATVALAIALHNIPEGLAIALPLHEGSASKATCLIATILSGLSEPLGAAFGLILLRYVDLTPQLIDHIEATVAGIMSSIAIFELIPEAFNQQKHAHSILGFCFGFLTIALTIYLLLDTPKPPLAFLDNAIGYNNNNLW